MSTCEIGGHGLSRYVPHRYESSERIAGVEQAQGCDLAPPISA